VGTKIQVEEMRALAFPILSIQNNIPLLGGLRKAYYNNYINT